jgi:hypothetical protein
MTPQGLIDRKDHARDHACGIWPPARSTGRNPEATQTASQG